LNNEQLLTIGGAPIHGRIKTIKYLNATDQWEDLCQLPDDGVAFEHSRACVCPKGIVVTGGTTSTNRSSFNHAWLLKPTTKQWKKLPLMNKSRHMHAIISCNNEIYVMGGIERIAIRTVEKLKLEMSGCLGWVKMKDLLLPLSNHAAVFVDSNIFVFGGKTFSDKDSLSLMAYDTASDKWSKKANMPVSCIDGAGIVLKKCLYVVSGASPNPMKYDIARNVWTLLVYEHRPHHHGAAAVWDNKLLLLGGYNRRGEPETEVSVYDPLCETWTTADFTLLDHEISYSVISTSQCW